MPIGSLAITSAELEMPFWSFCVGCRGTIPCPVERTRWRRREVSALSPSVALALCDLHTDKRHATLSEEVSHRRRTDGSIRLAAVSEFSHDLRWTREVSAPLWVAASTHWVISTTVIQGVRVILMTGRVTLAIGEKCSVEHSEQ